MLLPWLLICLPGLLGGVHFTPLYSTADLMDHLDEWNVWWRLTVVPLIMSYALMPVFLPYRWRESSASRKWIWTYVTIFVSICMFLLAWMLTQHPVLQVCHNLCSLILTATVTWFELVERVPVPTETRGLETTHSAEADATTDALSAQDDLWARIVKLLHEGDYYCPSGTYAYINTALGLTWVAKQINDGGSALTSIYIYKDIDLSDHYWTPIGTSTNKCALKTIDGRYHTISGLKVKDTSSDYQGLFGYIEIGSSWGEVKNLTVNGSVTGNDYVGGIVGYIKGSYLINCHFKGNITGNQYVGGISGYQYSYDTSFCHLMTGSTVTGSTKTGAITSLRRGGLYSNFYEPGSKVVVGGVAHNAEDEGIGYWDETNGLSDYSTGSSLNGAVLLVGELTKILFVVPEVKPGQTWNLNSYTLKTYTEGGETATPKISPTSTSRRRP